MSSIGFDKNNKLMLEQYIKQLIKENKLYKFYKSDEWQELREQIIFEQHNECILCRQKGVINSIDIVHHVEYVRSKPRLALSKYYVDKKGKQQLNLLGVCHAHHEQLHKRCTFSENNFNNNKSSKKLQNIERW